MAEAFVGSAALLVALTLDLLLGDPPNRWHPVAWLGSLISWGRRRFERGSRTALLVRGAALALGATALAGVAGWLVTPGAMWPISARVLIEGIALKCCLSLRGLIDAAWAVETGLRAGDLGGARRLLARHLVSRPTEALDEGRVASGAIESVAENLTDSLVAPICFYLALGLPGAFAYRAVNTADAMIGYRGGTLEFFGKVAARLDDVLNLVPARLAGCVLAVVAPVGGGGTSRAFSVMWRECSHTASPNAGWPMAAMAGALGVTLEKPGAYRLGRGSFPGPDDIARSRTILGAAALLITMLAAVASALRHGCPT